MKIVSWNCRGMGSNWTISYLREIWHKHKPEFFFSETKQDLNFFQGLQGHFGYDKLVTVEPRGSSGGLALFYNNDLNVNLLFTNNRMIDVEAEGMGKKKFMTFVYGDLVQKFRRQVWERLTRYGLQRTEPWFIIGDLNEITGNHEKQGGTSRNAGTFLAFNNMIRDCGLNEFPALGNVLSWQGRRGKEMLCCRLDRALAMKTGILYLLNLSQNI